MTKKQVKTAGMAICWLFINFQPCFIANPRKRRTIPEM